MNQRNILYHPFTGDQTIIDKFLGAFGIMLAMLMAIVPMSRILGFIPDSDAAYYAILMTGSAYSLIRLRSLSVPALILLAVCSISILVGSPDELFSPWVRLALFTLVIMSVFPLFQSRPLIVYRGKITYYTLWILVAVAIGSAICYFFGLNFMRFEQDYSNVDLSEAGTFGGLTTHSMILGPLSGIASVYMTCKLMKPGQNMPRIIAKTALLIGCVGALLLSASRGSLAAAAGGIAVALFLNNRHKFSSIANSLIILIIIAFAFAPLYMPLASGMIQKQENNLNAGSMFASREEKWGNRINEFSANPVFGIGFASMDIANTDDYNPANGINEPGSSWLAVLSMTGVAGLIVVGWMVLGTFFRLCKIAGPPNRDATLIAALLSVFIVHFVIEGYIYAGGSYLCYLFWLLLGNGYSLARLVKSRRSNKKHNLPRHPNNLRVR